MQYLAGVLICIALPLISQHWAVASLALPGIIIYYWNTYDEESRNIEKFGNAYRDYMQAVPRMNFILGIIRSARRFVRRRMG